MTEVDLKILAVEAQVWKLRGSKEQHVRDELKLSWVEYYYRLSKLIETQEAEAHSPVLVHRLRRLRDQMAYKKRRVREPEGES